MKTICILVISIIGNLIYSQDTNNKKSVNELNTVYLFSKNNFDTKIVYDLKTIWDSPEDSTNFVTLFNKYGEDIEDMVSTPTSEVAYIKNDTILVEIFKRDVQVPFEVDVRTRRIKYEKVRTASGRKMKWNKPYIMANYRGFAKYVPIPEEDETILGYECKAYIAKSRAGTNKLWVSNIDASDVNVKSTDIIANGYIVLKRSKHIHGRAVYTYTATSIDQGNNLNTGTVLNRHLQVNIKEKYEPLAANDGMGSKKLKVGRTAPDFNYRNVLDEDVSQLYDLTSNSEFTIVEFWGTWCIPCLIASEKIKELRNTHSTEKLAILSLNTADRNIEKVKAMIEKKEMEWEHGYSTERIIKVYNNKDYYPRVVILNKENKVLFLGNPNTDFEEMKEILSQ